MIFGLEWCKILKIRGHPAITDPSLEYDPIPPKPKAMQLAKVHSRWILSSSVKLTEDITYQKYHFQRTWHENFHSILQILSRSLGIVRFPNWRYFLWNLVMQILQDHEPSGGSFKGGTRQYMWYPRSQSSQNSSWSSFSDVPQSVQHLHSMHCHGYSLTEMSMLSENWRHVGWPEMTDRNWALHSRRKPIASHSYLIYRTRHKKPIPQLAAFSCSRSHLRGRSHSSPMKGPYPFRSWSCYS